MKQLILVALLASTSMGLHASATAETPQDALNPELQTLTIADATPAASPVPVMPAPVIYAQINNIDLTIARSAPNTRIPDAFVNMGFRDNVIHLAQNINLNIEMSLPIARALEVALNPLMPQYLANLQVPVVDVPPFRVFNLVVQGTRADGTGGIILTSRYPGDKFLDKTHTTAALCIANPTLLERITSVEVSVDFS